ncbi:MAG: Fic family protein [Nanoarchaeota archaeon]|nr:Fic family protein [Nanoarchaeota archaeon]
MVFERKVKSNGKEHWILVHNIRKGKKITQKSKYIGKTLPPKARLERLKKEFLNEIKKGRYKYLSNEEVEKIEKLKQDYNNNLRKLTLTEKKEKLKEFIIRFTYDSSKLSGVNITLRQTSLILKEGIMPKDFKNLRIAKEIENHKNGVLAITRYRDNLNIRFLKKLHTLLMLGIEDEIAGKLRSELKRDVKIAGTSYVPPKWQILDKEIENFFGWYKKENRILHPLELAALVHLKIISLQLFVDGNSRLSRLVMNWILWKKGYPLIDIPIEDIENYYDVLDKYQIEKKERPFINYIKQKYFES